MSKPAAKRRRIDLATSTLSKPFRSPFKTPLKTSTQTEDHEYASTPSKSSAPTPSAIPSVTPNPASRPLKISKFSAPIPTRKLDGDPMVVELMKKQRALEKQIREVKEFIDTAEQARKIEKDAVGDEVDGELLVLRDRWRGVSRQAAEEMFGGVKDRVNRMGGPRAWKEMQKRQEEFRAGFNQPEPEQAEEEGDGDGDRPDVEKRDLYAEYDINPETENEKSQRDTKDTGEEPGQEDEFTMAMMLRTLNVDLNIIGYDRETQRWTD